MSDDRDLPNSSQLEAEVNRNHFYHINSRAAKEWAAKNQDKMPDHLKEPIPQLSKDFVEFVEWIASMIEDDELWYGSEKKKWQLYGEEIGTTQQLFEYWYLNVKGK